MKSVLVIGLGRFGSYLARKMQALGNDVMVIDRNAAKIADAAQHFSDAQVADCCSEPALSSLGVENFDMCFVTMTGSFESAVTATALLRKLKAKRIIVKASSNLNAEIFMRLGADEVIQPERNIAEKLAVRYDNDNIFDFIELTKDCALYEIPILPSWYGKSIAELNVRRKYLVNIIALKRDGVIDPAPDADAPFCEGDHVIVLGKHADVEKLTAKV